MELTEKQTVKELMIKYGFAAPDMTVTEFVEDILPSAQPEPCEDAVSRKDVIDAARKVHDIFEGEYDTRTPYGVILDVQEAVIELPSVTPKRKTGKWKKIRHWSRCYRCDQCGNILDFDGVNAGRGDTNFCPNCGAKMNGDEQE